MPFDTVAVFGAGTMGHGIAQVCAGAGMDVQLYDVAEDGLKAGLSRIASNLEKGIARGKVTEQQREEQRRQQSEISFDKAADRLAEVPQHRSDDEKPQSARNHR